MKTHFSFSFSLSLRSFARDAYQRTIQIDTTRLAFQNDATRLRNIIDHSVE